MILTLVLGVSLMSQQTPAPLVCPMTAETVATSFANIDFNGIRFEMCCGGCPDGFKKDPAAAMKSDKLKGKTFGQFLFDPVSGKRIEAKGSAGLSDYKGIRYYFASADEKTKFDADPKMFVKTNTKESLFCPVAGAPVKSYAAAGGYVDVDGTRYYTCCADCLAKLKADPTSFISKVPADHVKSPAAIDEPKAK